MKKAFWLCPILLLGLLSATSFGQEKQKTVEAAKSDEQASTPVPLHVQVVFSEYEGDKKVVSLPYSFSVNADERRARPDTSIRDGVRLPVFVSKDSVQYLDIGTNIDCTASSENDGRYKLVLTLERSSISQDKSPTSDPIVRQFRMTANPILRDGQTFETVMATDPLNGHVYRVTVTLNVPKQ